MSGATFTSPINLNLPQFPQGIDDSVVQQEILRIYNALQILQQAIGSLSGAAYTQNLTYFQSLGLTFAQSIQVQNLTPIQVLPNQNIAAGLFVTLQDSAGLITKKADASAIGTRAWGWAPFALTNAVPGLVFLQSGYLAGFAGLTVGATYYLSSVTPGGISTAKPVGAGKIVQEVGIALSATELFVRLSTPIVL